MRITEIIGQILATCELTQWEKNFLQGLIDRNAYSSQLTHTERVYWNHLRDKITPLSASEVNRAGL